jgi:hypothetical protein
MYHFYNGTGGRNDLAWFSNSGPTPYGTIKPDVVAPGNTGFTWYTVITGLGNGSRASGTFGGTSESAPRAAGAIALLYEAMLKQNINPTLENIRVILKGTSDHLGFHPIQQGSGLINAYEAVTAIFGGDKIFVTSKETSRLAGQRLQPAYGQLFVDENEIPLDHPLVTNPLDDVVLSVLPEDINSGLNLTVKFSNGTLVPSNLFTSSVQRFEQTLSDRFSFTSKSGGSTIVNLTETWAMPTSWKNNDLLHLSFSLNLKSFEDLLDNGLQSPSIVLFDSLTENYVYDFISLRNWNYQLYSGNPKEDFPGHPMLRFTDPGFINEIPGWEALNFSVYAQTYDYLTWGGINTQDFLGKVNIIGQSIPNELQFASVLVEYNSLEVRMPILIAAEETVQFANTDSYVGDDLDVNSLYTLDSIYGSFDWAQSPNSGDSRYYRFAIPENATYFVVRGTWDLLGLQPNFYLFNSIGELLITSDIEYVGGAFYIGETSEKFAQNLIIEADDTAYTLMVHLSDSPFTPGPLDLRVYPSYLTLDSIPTPVPVFSQDISQPIQGEISIDVSNYNVNQFSYLEVTDIATQVYQGSNGSIKDVVEWADLKLGVASNASEMDSVEYLNLKAGEKVYLELEWSFELDADIYVIGPDQIFSIQNDLLAGQGATPGTDFEKVQFGADRDGNYSIYIDYIGDLLRGLSLKYTINWESRDGPTINGSGDSMSINSTYFSNGDFGFRIQFQTNFNLEFEQDYMVSFQNHVDFTAELISPSLGEISGSTTVEWSSSKAVIADVYLQIGQTTIILGRAIGSNSLTFDSSLYQNGPAILIVILTDGFFSKTVQVEVTINNSSPSTLPSPAGKKSDSLPIFDDVFVLFLLIVIGFPILRKRKKLKR